MVKCVGGSTCDNLKDKVNSPLSGKYGEFESASCMRKTLTETKYKVKTCFCFSFCMEAFFGDTEDG
jgi:hypothetical protein